mmetsp:Transcript_9624/g.24755  ORF Transcript_9624/g.24755 Transcript_9624/m.24755 type:complete len:211 (-) Transcript_9624:134-766(-)
MSTFPGASSSVLGLQLPRRRRRGCHCRHCCLGLGLREAADQSRRAGLPQPTTLLGVPGVLDGCAASKAACVGGVRQNPTERGTEDSGKFWALVRRRCGRVLQHDVVRDAQAQIKKLAPALVQLVLKARHRHGAAAVAAVHLVQPGPKILPATQQQVRAQPVRVLGFNVRTPRWSPLNRAPQQPGQTLCDSDYNGNMCPYTSSPSSGARAE